MPRTNRNRRHNQADWRRYEPPIIDVESANRSPLRIIGSTLSRLLARTRTGLAPAVDALSGLTGLTGDTQSSPLALGALLGALDWDHVREEVDRESRARITIIGAPDSGKTTLMRWLKNASAQTDAPHADADDSGSGRFRDLGLFALKDVIAEPGQSDLSDVFGGNDGIGTSHDSSDLVVWLLDAQAGLRRWEYEAICRQRATGRPLLIALNKCDLLDDEHRQEPERLAKDIAQPVIPISARTGHNVNTRLLPAMASACPNLALALGREVPAWRSEAVRNVTQRAAVLSGLAGVEPVPLVDLPFQALIQLRLVLRIAAAYGEPVGDRYSRELIATLLGSAGVRVVGQQLSKVVPVVGWAASGALAAAATYAIGKMAASYFENGRKFTVVDMHALRGRWANRFGRRDKRDAHQDVETRQPDKPFAQDGSPDPSPAAGSGDPAEACIQTTITMEPQT